MVWIESQKILQAIVFLCVEVKQGMKNNDQLN